MLKDVSVEIYRLLHPKLICFLTSKSMEGQPNIMTCAWISPASEDPPLVMAFVSKGSYTAQLINATKEFALSIPTKKFSKAIWIVGTTSGREVNKFEKAKLQTQPAKKIDVPVISGCVGYIECKLLQTIEAGECYGFLGKVEAAYVETQVFRNKLWTEQAQLIMHLGGKKLVRFKSL